MKIERNIKNNKAVSVFKRGENLIGIIYRDYSNNALPYWGEVKHGENMFTSANYVDEDFVEQWIDNKFNSIIGGKK